MSSSEENSSDEDTVSVADTDIEEYIVERRTTGKLSRPNSAMYVAIVTAMFGAIMFGIDTTNFGAVIDFATFEKTWCVGKYGNNLTCSHDETQGASKNHEWLSNFISWANLLVFLGAGFGAVLFGPPIANGRGRRPCISAGAGITFVGCLLTSYLSFHHVPTFFFGRLLTGIGIGLCCFALPMYNAEVSAPSVRGTTGAIFQLFVALGGLLAAGITAVCTDWRIGMMLPGFAAIVVACAIWLTPESPRFVMGKDGQEAGEAQLKKVRKGDVKREAQDMFREIEEEAAAGVVSFHDLFCKKNLRKRVAIACWMQIAQQFTGMNTIIMYSGTLFRDMGFEQPLIVNFIFNCFGVVGMIIGMGLMDSQFGGRRSQLLKVTPIIGTLLLLTGLGINLDWSNTLVLVFVSAFAFIWQMAWGMIPWVYPSEIFSTSERDRAMSFAVFTQYNANAVLLYLVPLILNAFKIGGTMFFFAAFNILNFAFVFAYVKESKGLPLEDIPVLFDSKARFRQWMKGRSIE